VKPERQTAVRERCPGRRKSFGRQYLIKFPRDSFIHLILVYHIDNIILACELEISLNPLIAGLFRKELGYFAPEAKGDGAARRDYRYDNLQEHAAH
jgi:hypothetical protein